MARARLIREEEQCKRIESKQHNEEIEKKAGGKRNEGKYEPAQPSIP
jgi:hypothetical protein